jgi:hypothetical protein
MPVWPTRAIGILSGVRDVETYNHVGNSSDHPVRGFEQQTKQALITLLLAWQALADSNVHFSWHEFNGQHAFMRDEG